MLVLSLFCTHERTLKYCRVKSYCNFEPFLPTMRQSSKPTIKDIMHISNYNVIETDNLLFLYVEKKTLSVTNQEGSVLC